MELKNSKTWANLLAAFAGESQARNKYTYFAAKARKDGFVQMANIFEQTAANEKEHAEIWFKLINGQPADTVVNLDNAAEGERYEEEEMYPGFAQTARDEGFNDIAVLFDMVAKIEKEHKERFLTLKGNIENSLVFERAAKQTWVCSNCGYIHEGSSAPQICPVCSHARGYFELRATNY